MVCVVTLTLGSGAEKYLFLQTIGCARLGEIGDRYLRASGIEICSCECA